jgi:hypothetical protein
VDVDVFFNHGGHGGGTEGIKRQRDLRQRDLRRRDKEIKRLETKRQKDKETGDERRERACVRRNDFGFK